MSITKIVDGLLTDLDVHHREVVISPVLWRPDDNDETKRIYYFIVAVCKKGGDVFNAKIDTLGDRSDGIAARSAVMTEMMTSKRHKPLLIHGVDDELAMVDLCCALWPSPQTAEIRDLCQS